MSGDTGMRVDHGVTSGTFSLDGGTWDVDNNVWVLGDDDECIVVDAPHDAGPILALVGGCRVVAVLCTHAHDDHVTAAADLTDATGAPAYLHPDDRMPAGFEKVPGRPLTAQDSRHVAAHVASDGVMAPPRAT